MKVIFLDIDGVMTTNKHLKMSDKYFGMEFDPEALSNLKYIIEKTDAWIVVTSTWRIGRRVTEMKDIFANYGLNGRIAGITPVINNVPRGKEIAEYIESYDISRRYKVDKFVIIDDDTDMEHLSDYLIKTDFMVGLTKEQADKAIEMLL